MSGEQQPAQHRPTRTSARAIRALLTDREYIKTTAYLLPRRAKIQVLEMMERLRRERWDRAAAGEGPAPLPEMTGAELVREINWRIGTLPPHDAETVARYVHRLTRWRSTRRRRVDGRGATNAEPAAGRTISR